jgi:hypothetical protein
LTDLRRNILKTIRVGIVVGTLFGTGLVGVSFALYFIAQIFLNRWEVQVAVVAIPPLWFLGYIGAGVAAGLQTKRVAAGVVAGVWGGFVGMALVLMVIVLKHGGLVPFFGSSDPMAQYAFIVACACVVGAVAGTVGSASVYFYGCSYREEPQSTLPDRSSEDIENERKGPSHCDCKDQF